jgi:hypothetical protein
MFKVTSSEAMNRNERDKTCKQILSSYPSLFRQYNNELPPDNYLDEENKRIQEDKVLSNPSISQWRKNKILNNRHDDEGEVKTY